jgi:hypothetical protein
MQSAFGRIISGNGQDSSHCRQMRGAGPRHLPWRQNPSGGGGLRAEERENEVRRDANEGRDRTGDA